ncbi:HD domain-containing phosphohydrolase [Sporosarcina sp. NPDC096371]|uniref:HD domain-containing phosphohydrolase n=1 Tax=Sporosarcina sp. NPDC096371 TaxID=3364530 RepID=UPI0037FF85AB
MDNFITKHINEVSVNEILALDIYMNDHLVIAKDTILTDRMLAQLRRRRIREIPIKDMQMEQEDVILDEAISFIPPKEVSRQIDEQYKKVFWDAFEHVRSEQRYGHIAHNKDEFDFIMNLFIKMHNENNFIDKLYRLKEVDHYSFIHSFDVFVLGALFAKSRGVTDLESVALGYLFHDIGKLYVPSKLLKSERKLSHDEFKTMKTHATAGYNILNSLGQQHIAEFAKSHHERMDGSGYPEQLTGEDMSIPLKILHLVDVYSALTLSRPYKKAIHASEALEILYRERHKFDPELLSEFVEFINIYPLNSTVLLSDNSFAVIEQVNGGVPMLPKVKRLHSAKGFDLPNDFKLTIFKMINYQTKTFKEIFKGFTHNLIVGNEQQMMKDYTKLTDGMQLEEIYFQVFVPLYRIFDLLYEENKIDHALYHKCNATLMQLLQDIEDHLIKDTHYRSTTLFVLQEAPQQSLELKIVMGLLHIERIFPVVVDQKLTAKKIRELVKNRTVESVCIVQTTNTGRSDDAYFFPSMKIRNLEQKDITALMESVADTSKHSVNIYEQLFSMAADGVL